MIKPERTFNLKTLASSGANAFLDALPVPVALIAQRGSQVVAANPRFLEMVACTAEEIQHQPFSAVFEWVDPLARQTLVALLRNEETVTEVTAPLRLRNGEERIIQFVFEPMQTDGRLHFLCCCRDLTDQLLAEAAFEESRRVLTLLMDNLPGVVYRCSWTEEGWMLHFVSDGFERLTGHPTNAWIGRSLADLFAVLRHPEDQSLSDHQRAGRTLENNTFNRVYRIITASGAERWVREQRQQVTTVPGASDVLEGLITDITHTKADEVLQHSHDQLSRLTERLHTAREEERTYIAREIHDVLGHSLAVLKLNMEWLAVQELERPIVDRINQAKDQLSEAIQDVQRIAADLHPTLLDNFGLDVALEWQAVKFEEHTGITCIITDPMAKVKPVQERDTHIFRIFQELLTNIARHADAQNAWISFIKEAGHLILEVQDDGCGIPERALESINSLGLVGMRERARQLGGTIYIQGKPGQGTRVTLRIPWAKTKKETA